MDGHSDGTKTDEEEQRQLSRLFNATKARHESLMDLRSSPLAKSLGEDPTTEELALSLKSTDPAKRATAAYFPRALPYLTQLIADPDDRVRAMVASAHGNQRLHEYFLADQSLLVLWQLVNANSSPSIMKAVYHDERPLVACIVLATHNDEPTRSCPGRRIPAEAMAIYAASPYLAIQRLVATNPFVTRAHMQTLAASQFAEVRLEVAKSRLVWPELLEFFSTDSDHYVRAAVAGHPLTPPAVLQTMAQDSNLQIRWRIVENPATWIGLVLWMKENGLHPEGGISRAEKEAVESKVAQLRNGAFKDIFDEFFGEDEGFTPKSVETQEHKRLGPPEPPAP